MKAQGHRKLNAGGVLVWLLIIGIVGAVLYFLNGHPELMRLNTLTAPVAAKPRPSPKPTPEPEPEPEPTPEATPRPTATPTPTPAVEATPTPEQPTPAPTATPTPSTQSNTLFAVTVIRQNGSSGAANNEDKEGYVILNVQLANNTATMYPGLKCTVFTLAESLLNPDNIKVIGITAFSCPLPPNGRFDRITDKADVNMEEPDPNAARYGFKYTGWLLRLTDKEGKVVFEKASAPEVLKYSEEIAKTPLGDKYTTRP